MTRKVAISIIALMFVLVPALPTLDFGSSNYVESNSASDLTMGQTCNSVSALASLAPQTLVLSGATSGTWTVSITKSSTQTVVLYTQAGHPGLISWAAGTYTVNLNVTATSSNVTWNAACIVRVNTSGTAQATVGSATFSTSFGSTGVKSQAVSGSVQSANNTDRMAVVINLNNNASSGAKTVNIEAGNTTNDIVSVPWSEGAAGGPPHQLLTLGTG